jgi:hypothetical protein
MERSLVLSVSLGTGCYRHIQISESATLFDLSSAILDSVGFYNDHLHSFFMDNRAWSEDAAYSCPNSELDGACGFTDQVRLSKFHLVKGDKFLYIFDYGDDWRFHIRVLRVIDKPTRTPLVLKSVGEISQYGRGWDDEDDDEDDDSGF